MSVFACGQDGMEPEDVAVDDAIVRMLQPHAARRHSFTLPRRSRSTRRQSASLDADHPHARVLPSPSDFN